MIEHEAKLCLEIASQRILVYIKNKPDSTITKIHLGLKITYAHTSRLMRVLDGKGLLQIQKTGRCSFIGLSKKGLYIADMYDEIHSLLGIEEEYKVLDKLKDMEV